MAQISFKADENGIQNLSGSGLGFYGSSFGSSVAVGSYQDSTFITDGNGTIQGPQVHNTKWAHPNSGIVNGVGPWALNSIPNRLASLQIGFNHSTPVKVQNAYFRIYDRSGINNAASGVTTKVAELIHPNPDQAAAAGSGDTSWLTPAGSSIRVPLADSPGLSGYSPNGSNTMDMNHDWFLILAASPDSVGAKTLYGGYVELEYL